MNFAEVLKTSGNQLAWSPDGRFCAVPVTARLEIRDSVSLQVLVTYSCTDVIQVCDQYNSLK